MGGVLAGALRTPIAAIVMVMEMTGGYGLIVPLMIVCISSYLVGARYGLIDEQVPGPADSPAHAGDTVIGLLERARVHEAMRGVWPAVVERATPLARVVAALPAGDAPLAVVLEHGRVAGVIAVAELRDVLGTDGAARGRDRRGRDGDPVRDALARTSRSTRRSPCSNAGPPSALPVVDDRDGSFLGVLTRAAVHERVVGDLGAVREQLLREHAGLAAFEEQSQLASLLSGLPAPEAGAIARLPVDAELVGRSLREVDFRRTRGGVVLAIQTAEPRRHLPARPRAPPPRRRPPGRPAVAVVLRRRRQPTGSPSRRSSIAKFGHERAAARTASSGSPGGSATTALRCASSENVAGARSAQARAPVQASRSTCTSSRLTRSTSRSSSAWKWRSFVSWYCAEGHVRVLRASAGPSARGRG